jgi:hypothetical protein
MAFSSVKVLNRSLAAAMKSACTSIGALLSDSFSSAFLTGFAGTDGLVVDAEGAAEFVADVEAVVGPTGVAERLGSVLTVRSLPWVSMMALANSANLTSSAVGSLDLASAYNASTGEEDAVSSVQSYYIIRINLNTFRLNRRTITYHVV